MTDARTQLENTLNAAKADYAAYAKTHAGFLLINDGTLVLITDGKEYRLGGINAAALFATQAQAQAVANKWNQVCLRKGAKSACVNPAPVKDAVAFMTAKADELLTVLANAPLKA